MLFTKSDVMTITGMSSKRFRILVESGALAPVAGGGTQGSHRQLTLMQVLGLTVVERMRATLRGCTNKGAQVIVAAFENVTPEWLEERFQRREVAWVMEHDGRPLLRERQPDRVDVQECWKHVQREIERIQRESKPSTGGRVRGLARTAS